MNNHIGVKGGGIGFFGLLAIAFIVLKLVGVINWPWIWVLGPIWIPVLAILIFWAILFVYAFIKG